MDSEEMLNNGEDLQADERYRRLKRDLKLLYLKQLENINSLKPKMSIWPSLSSITCDTAVSSTAPSEAPLNPRNEIISYSNNMRNVVKYLNDHVNVNYAPSLRTPEAKGDLFESILMPPPASNNIKISRKSLNKNNNHQKLSPSKSYEPSVSDIFKPVSDSDKNVRVFHRWTLILNDAGQLIVKGKIKSGEIARSRPIAKRLTFTKLESVYHHMYQLEGNLFDLKKELPKYVREKFINGFPDDWQNVQQLWHSYVKENKNPHFRWPTPITDSDYELADDANNFSAKTSEENLSVLSNASVVENDTTRSIKSSVIQNADQQSTISTKLIRFLSHEVLATILQGLADKNCPPEYVSKVRQMLNCLDYIASYHSKPNNSIHTNVNDSKSNYPDDISICTNYSLMTMPLRSSPIKISKKSSEEEDSCMGVPKISPNFLSRLPQPRQHKKTNRKRASQLSAKLPVIEQNFDDVLNDSSISIVTECRAETEKNRQLEGRLKIDKSRQTAHREKIEQIRKIENNSKDDLMDKDSGCHSVTDKRQFSREPVKRKIHETYDDLSNLSYVDSEVSNKILKKDTANSKPVVVSVEKANYDLKLLQSKKSLSDVKKKRIAKEEKPKAEKLEQQFKKSIEEISDSVYGSQKNPKIVKSWFPVLLYDNNRQNQCNLVIEGTLLNEAGQVLSKKYRTDLIVQRIKYRVFKTSTNEFIKLESGLANCENLPHSMRQECLMTLPKNILAFCDRWKQIIDRETSEPVTNTRKMNAAFMQKSNLLKTASVTEPSHKITGNNAAKEKMEPKPQTKSTVARKLLYNDSSSSENMPVEKEKPVKKTKRQRNKANHIRNLKSSTSIKGEYTKVQAKDDEFLTDDQASMC